MADHIDQQEIKDNGQQPSDFGVLPGDKLPVKPLGSSTSEDPSADGNTIKETNPSVNSNESHSEKIKTIQAAYYLAAGKIDSLESEAGAHRDILNQISADQSSLTEKVEQQMASKADLQCFQIMIEDEVGRLKETVKELKHRLLGEPKESPLDSFSPSPFKIPKLSEKKGSIDQNEKNPLAIPRKALEDCPLCRDSAHRLADCPQFPSKLEKLQQFRRRQICCTCGTLQCSRINCPKAMEQCQICKGKQEYGKTLHISEICIFESHVAKRPNASEYRRPRFSAQRPRSKSPAKETPVPAPAPVAQPTQNQQTMMPQQQYHQQPMLPAGPAYGPSYQMSQMVPAQQFQYQQPQQMVPMQMQPMPQHQYGYYQQQSGPANPPNHHHQ